MIDMTGLERLRELAEGLQPDRDLWYLTSTEYDRTREGRGESTVGSTLNETLASIADQIEAEQEERITRRLEDREAAEWVHAHGGLHGLMDVLDRRLMPEGVEWPRFEDGEPVRIGGTAQFGDDVTEVVGVELNHFGYVLHGSINDGMRECVDGDEYGVAVRRPAPKVLDADGVEIRVGEHVWHVETGREYVVVEPSYGKTVVVRLAKYDDAEGEQYTPDQLTHRAPVLAADGKPLREGETVYLQDGESFTVREAMDDGKVYVRELANFIYLRAERLIHECPDSWERLEKDIDDGPCLYFGRKSCMDCPGNGRNGCEGQKAKARDLVLRARALAERGSDE